MATFQIILSEGQPRHNAEVRNKPRKLKRGEVAIEGNIPKGVNRGDTNSTLIKLVDHLMTQQWPVVAPKRK